MELMEPISLDTVANELHLEAMASPSKRAARTLQGGTGHALRQTVIALCAGTDLSDHEGPDEATLQVLRGRVRITRPQSDTLAEAVVDMGEILLVPRTFHGLRAVNDAVILLTVSMAEAADNARPPVEEYSPPLDSAPQPPLSTPQEPPSGVA
ncbi:cupin [Streptomyces sp. SID11385]|uniref:cupin n=1 Tax=Streptomyces sp. SID11385 TaxID=2706031 RepID=UPI0013C9B880|nr:cupin [Streptomyces sp. SID11385]NEA42641.1 cupin [Streptomyces sp. SID11385]